MCAHHRQAAPADFAGRADFIDGYQGHGPGGTDHFGLCGAVRLYLDILYPLASASFAIGRGGHLPAPGQNRGAGAGREAIEPTHKRAGTPIPAALAVIIKSAA